MRGSLRASSTGRLRASCSAAKYAGASAAVIRSPLECRPDARSYMFSQRRIPRFSSSNQMLQRATSSTRAPASHSARNASFTSPDSIAVPRPSAISCSAPRCQRARASVAARELAST